MLLSKKRTRKEEGNFNTLRLVLNFHNERAHTSSKLLHIGVKKQSG